MKVVIKCLTLLLLAINPLSNVFAQSPYDSLSVNYSYFPKKGFKEMTGKTTINYFDVNLATPTIKLGKHTSLTNLFGYKFYSYNFEGLEQGWNNLPTQLHDIRFNPVFRHQFSDNWGIVATLRINIRSDLKESLSSKDFVYDVTAYALRTSKKNPNLQWGIGVSYNNDLNPNTIVPVFALNYVSEKMRVNMLLPINGQIIFTPTKKFEYGFSFANESAFYHLHPTTIKNSEAVYLKNLSFLVSPTAYFNLSHNIWLNLKAGYVLNMNYDVWNKAHEAVNASMENKFKAAPFLSAGISVRLKN